MIRLPGSGALVLALGMSYRDVEELLAEGEIDVDYVTVNLSRIASAEREYRLATRPNWSGT